MSVSNPSPEARPLRRVLRLIPLVALLAGGLWGALTLGDTLSFETLRDNRSVLLAFRDDHMGLMALGFVAVYVLVVALSLPGAAVVSVTGGFLFGLLPGVALNILGATLGASVIFLVARWGAGEALAARMALSEGRLARWRAALRDHEINVLLLLRLVPVMPFFLANLLPALAGVRFGRFFWTTAVGIIPGALVFTWIGVGVGAIFARGGSPDLSLIWQPYVLGPILALCVLAALPVALKRLRRGVAG
ncbi:TVP38/TMEM64 family protein [Pseudodonghicola xiamenensis]|uniref:TVP38/TMEM64 family membrane protein n=1 Tax=Pseudodonghicola xiamenensis TaxID=337702 RepID=A0A8J3MCJ5_9RHOB|nr:VTT domain-containing protein [Pseudodonghicola xiamenensis]GHG84721.1 TVP38/TMEM64 family protein [Pseudodonghicola xiamenensis]